MIFKLSIVVFTLFMIGCKDKPQNSIDLLFESSESRSISSKEITLNDKDISLDFMYELQYSDSLLFINEYPDPTHCLKIVDLETRNIYLFGKKGRGPGEMEAQAVEFSIDRKYSQLFVADNKNYYIYPLDSLRRHFTNTEPIDKFSLLLPNNHFMQTVYNCGTIIGGTIKRPFGLYNISKDSLITSGRYKTNAMSDQSFFVSHPSQSRVAYFAFKSSEMGLITVEDSISLDIKTIIDSEDRKSGNIKKNGHITATASNNYIYVLYSGKEINMSSLETLTSAFISNRVYLFDWNGDPVRYYDLDCNVRSIAVDMEDNTLYAASYEDMPTLVSFRLK